MENNSTALIVHLCPRQHWLLASQRGEYAASSLAQAGFMHASRPEQILGVANAFYRGLSDLVLLWIDPRLVQSEIRWEAADGDHFPHIYGPLNIAAVVAVTAFTPDPDGTFRQITYPFA